MTRTCLLASMMLFSMLIQGCSVIDGTSWQRLLSLTPVLKKVSIEASDKVNGGYPVALDLVLVRDKLVYASLSNLTASEWYAGKKDYMRQHKQVLSVMAWEVVPGQRFQEVAVVADSDAVGALVFAGYLGERTYRSAVQGVKQVWIRLNDEDFEVRTK